ncbi:MAG: metallophosphatase [Chitinophagaceae bacterium]|nr:metallophosphatase [Chitinophagaceae bacterium]MCW5903957.1 metallophosphatase [Chitinophagaceae bacterium]
MQRRKFIKETTFAGGALLASSLLPLNSFCVPANDVKNITILHTNDVHSRLEPFSQEDNKNAGLGGVAARAALINDIRAEVEHVLLLDAGDFFQGTPYFNLYKGEPEIKAMNLMGYNAATLGEHDFEAGMDNLANQISKATFPIVICNYNFTNTPMEGKAVPYTIIKKGNIKIGILGVGIDNKGLIPDELFKNAKYNNPIESANTVADILKKENCDMIICLSHLGDRYNDDTLSDEILAKENYHIDLIIGGHTHKFFKEPKKYFNRNGNNTLVNQAGWAGMQLGRLDYSLSRTKNKNTTKSQTIVIRKKNAE